MKNIYLHKNLQSNYHIVIRYLSLLYIHIIIEIKIVIFRISMIYTYST